MTVFWTDRAFDDLWAIREFAGRTSAAYAERVAERLVGRSEQLSAFAYSGRSVYEAGRPEVREVYERPYRILYRVREDENRVEVLAVLHERAPGPRL